MAPRSLKHKRSRRKFALRSKLRPEGSRYEIEIRTGPVRDMPEAVRTGYKWVTAEQQQAHVELYAFVETIRRNIGGGFKIIQHSRRGMIQTKVLLEREADLYFLAMAHPDMIHRAYRYR